MGGIPWLGEQLLDFEDRISFIELYTAARLICAFLSEIFATGNTKLNKKYKFVAFEYRTSSRGGNGENKRKSWSYSSVVQVKIMNYCPL
jgi:hypothetical protein